MWPEGKTYPKSKRPPGFKSMLIAMTRHVQDHGDGRITQDAINGSTMMEVIQRAILYSRFVFGSPEFKPYDSYQLLQVIAFLLMPSRRIRAQYLETRIAIIFNTPSTTLRRHLILKLDPRSTMAQLLKDARRLPEQYNLRYICQNSYQSPVLSLAITQISSERARSATNYKKTTTTRATALTPLIRRLCKKRNNIINFLMHYPVLHAATRRLQSLLCTELKTVDIS